MNKFQADAVAFGATPTTEHGARIGGPGLSGNGHSYVADPVTERKNDPVIRRLLQTLAAANVQEPEFSAIKKILEQGVPPGADFDGRGRSAIRLLMHCKNCNTDWTSILHVGAQQCSLCREMDYARKDNEKESERLARRTWFELIWDKLLNNVE